MSGEGYYPVQPVPATTQTGANTAGCVVDGLPFSFYKPSPDRELFTGPDTPGRIVVTRFDTVARVVSGTVEFTARHDADGTLVRVSEGRFDCKF